MRQVSSDEWRCIALSHLARLEKSRALRMWGRVELLLQACEPTSPFPSVGVGVNRWR